MSIEAELQKHAVDMYAELNQKELSLKSEKAKLEDQLSLLQVQLDLLRGRDERITSFLDELRGGLICPECWVKRKVRAVVKPIDGGTKDHDFFRCSGCSTEFSAFI